MDMHAKYMDYAIQLSSNAIGNVAPNPLVGAVLVFEDKIIGEGYHQKYGEAHAEVNCIASVSPIFKKFISQSTLYVTLEPCSHHGKTSPCVDLILESKIPKVVIAVIDPYEQVNGKGIDILKENGVEVIIGVQESEARFMNRRFMIAQEKKRPYIILKWAETKNGFIGNENGERLLITKPSLNTIVHQWRAEEQAILVGTQTALKDNPRLTIRNIQRKNPIRILIDKKLLVPHTNHIFNDEAQTIVLNQIKNDTQNNIEFIKLENDFDLKNILDVLFQKGIQSILVEGGAKILQSFFNANFYDEVRKIVSSESGGDVHAPNFKLDFDIHQEVDSQSIYFYYNKN